MDENFREFEDCRSTGVGGFTTYRLIRSTGDPVPGAVQGFNASGTGNHWSERVQLPENPDECIIRLNRSKSVKDFEAVAMTEPAPEWVTEEFLRRVAQRFQQQTLDVSTRNRYEA